MRSSTPSFRFTGRDAVSDPESAHGDPDSNAAPMDGVCRGDNRTGLQPRRRRLLGFTLIEALVTTSLGTLTLGALLVLLVETSREQRRGVVDTALQEQAALLQDKILRLLRPMSASESVALGDPISSGSLFYRKLVVARGQAPAYPREEIYFNPTTFQVTHDPNRSTTGGETVLFKPTAFVTLRNMYFHTSLKPDGAMDGSAVNVWLQFDDSGLAGRKSPNGTPKVTQLVRSFTVAMRNN